MQRFCAQYVLLGLLFAPAPKTLCSLKEGLGHRVIGMTGLGWGDFLKRKMMKN